MTDERTIALLHAALDGALGPAEQAELDDLLRDSADARALHAELNAVHQVLAAAPQVPVPNGLHQRIVDSVELPAALAEANGDTAEDAKEKANDDARAKGRGWFPSWREWRDSLRLPALAPYGVSAAAGALLAVLVMGDADLGRDMAQGAGPLSGTLAPGVAREVELLGTLRVDKPGLYSSVTLELRDGVPVVDLIVESDGEASVDIDFSATGWRFGLLGQLDGNAQFLQVSKQVIRTRGRGRQRIAVQLDAAPDGGEALFGPALIRLDYQLGGASVHQATLGRSTATGQVSEG